MIVEYSIQSTTTVYVVQKSSNNTHWWPLPDTEGIE